MPTNYLGRTIFTAEEFAADQAAGLVNPLATYADYLAMIRAQHELRREAEEKAQQEGYELGAPQLELTEEDELILDRVWAKLAARKAAEQQAARTAERAA